MNGERKEPQTTPPAASERSEPERRQDLRPKEKDEIDEKSLDAVLRECPL